MNDLYISRASVSRVLGVSMDTVDRLASKGELRKTKIGARTLFYVPDVEDFARKLVQKGAVSLA